MTDGSLSRVLMFRPWTLQLFMGREAAKAQARIGGSPGPNYLPPCVAES